MERMAARSDRAYVAALSIIEDVDRLDAISSTLAAPNWVIAGFQ
jgi:hypothetical protein